MEQKEIYNFRVETIEGREETLKEFKGKVLLIVNTASKCGFTPQYEGLQHLYEKYKDQGLVILGFPCNQFAGQEPADNDAIMNFCKLNYGVTFPLFSKIKVNGKNAHPLYKYLKKKAGGLMVNTIKWNFTKFLIDREGNVVKRFAPSTTPESLEKEMINYLVSVHNVR
ncbi:MAG TPA: glutathione peroxidase [Bacteroidales bacterium]|nr:glutathione peroxidase [Bacteroidales bacterium]